MTKKPTIAVAMSGGVDSSVSAALLKKQGYSIVGVFMKNYTDPTDSACTTEQDRAEAVRAASFLNIPFEVIDLEKEYRAKVVDYFYSEYEKGRTPNPDVMCNKAIKFGIFLKKALKELGVDYVATGHYAQVTNGNGFHLLKGNDPKKDQSYFLYTLKQEALAKTMFPVGGFSKTKIRQIAREFGLPNANRPDSQGICFIGEVNIVEFLKKRIPERLGKVLDLQGNVVGEHKGVAFYTLGQREGIGVSGSSIPYYVVRKDAAANTLIVASLNAKELFHRGLIAKELSWVGEPPKIGSKLMAKVRYGQVDQEVLVKEITQDFLDLEFAEEQRAITPGQSVVLYKDNEVVGGGIIEEVKS